MTLRSRAAVSLLIGKIERHRWIGISLKLEMVLRVIYMSIGVRVGLLHWQVHAAEWCIIGVILAKHIVLKIAITL